MASPGDEGGAAKANDLRVLLPFTCNELRIPDELAEEIGAEEALVVGPAGGKVKLWPVEVGQDDDGAFLGRGWPEFAKACGAGAGWFLVLRHRGRGVLSAKAFDATCCLVEVGAPAPPAVQATTSIKDSTHKPQFLRVLAKDFMEKMLIPAKFVQQHIPKEFLDKGIALVLGPIAKLYSIKLEMGQSGMFFAGGWLQFLKFHRITEANALLLRYEGNMLFTLKVYEPNGYQRESKHKENRGRQISTLPNTEEQREVPSASMQKQQEAPLVSIQMQHENDLTCSNGEKEPQGSTTSLGPTSFKIGPPSWIEKQINANTLKNHVNLPKAFCDAIGLRESCKITLKTSRNGSEYWQVHGLPCKNSNYQLGKGWKRFCQENTLREGDICTFSVIESTMWHVIITRSLPGIEEQQEAPSASIQKQYNNMLPSSCGKKKPQGSTASLDKAPFKRKSVYQIGPPSWIEKQINASTLKNRLALPKAFCDGIGLQKGCMITLKASMNGEGSWQVHGCLCNDSRYLLQQGWRRFCLENGLKEGDICTFNVIKSTMWHVLITSYVQEQHKTPFAFSRTRKRRNDGLSTEGQKKRKGSNTFLKNTQSSARSVYEIGPPTWIKKEISNRMIRRYITFPATFCDAIGLREASTITFKTSPSSTGSWQVRVVPFKNTSHQVVSGWKKFCRENEIKEGDVCTFNVVETMLWHVVVDRCYLLSLYCTSATSVKKGWTMILLNISRSLTSVKNEGMTLFLT